MTFNFLKALEIDIAHSLAQVQEIIFRESECVRFFTFFPLLRCSAIDTYILEEVPL